MVPAVLRALLPLLLACSCPGRGPTPVAPPPAAVPLIPTVAWTALEAGLDFGQVNVSGGALSVLRVDPARFDLVLVATSPSDPENRTAREWARAHDLVAATNGGMYDVDDTTHVGQLLREGGWSGTVRDDYLSLMVAGPSDAGLPRFALRDLDPPSPPIAAVAAGYAYAVQNLRLIAHKGENRWPQQPRQWSEAALAQDDQGRALLVFLRAPLSMHDFNAQLLALPLGVVAAQHLDGGPPAQLAINHPALSFEGVGTYETGAFESHDQTAAWDLPFVLGVRRQLTGHAPAEPLSTEPAAPRVE